MAKIEMMDANCVHDEDEDVIIQDSALYKHLHEFGYTDFETMFIKRSTIEKCEKPKAAGLMNCIKNLFNSLCTMYSWTLQEESISQKQLITILDVQALLDDHACVIHDAHAKYCKSWSILLQEFILFGTIITSSVYMSLNTRYKISTGLFASSTLAFICYLKYSRLCACKCLKSMVSLQNDLYGLCKKGLNILRYEYKINLDRGKCIQQFHDLTADKLKFLQPITEGLLKYMEHMSRIYYQVSIVLVKLLPKNALYKNSLTRFDNDSLQVRGQMNYRILKKLYHTYILTQSEMLHLLAIAYDSHTWHQSWNKIPELKLYYIVHSLTASLTVYKDKLSKVINAYYDFKVQPVIYKHKVSAASKWQDLYIHLHLTSSKLQLAYSHILSILHDIDNINETFTDESLEAMMQTLNTAYKDIDVARNFTEFSSLLLAKTKLNNHTNDRSEIKILPPPVNSDAPAINNVEHEITDEVFEEYIKEEYLKPLHNEIDEVSLENYKWDKFLAKNFMAELKDALVDVQKSMSERESKVLQRMYKNVMKETDAKADCHRVPTPPPLPSSNVCSTIQKPMTPNHDKDATPSVTREVRLHTEQKLYTREEIDNDYFEEERSWGPSISLPRIQLETQATDFSLRLPPPFLKTDEETFVGSGENSEEEIESENVEIDN